MFRRTIFPTLLTSLLTTGASFAAEVSHEAHAAAEHAEKHHGLSMHAPEVLRIGSIPISNSIIAMAIVTSVLILFAQLATRKVSLIPSGLQNLAEVIVEALENFLAGILGEKMARQTFWFFGSVFIFIISANWMGLLPGVGTFGHEVEYSDGTTAFVPFLRGANADLNMTLSLALIFFALWLYWSIKSNGIGGFLSHIFVYHGEDKGAIRLLLMVIFFLVGFLEVISILIRPVSLTFRLYGNIYAGESLLETMIALGGQYFGWLTALPFYFMEMMVGGIQALVFTLLTAVFTSLMCSHSEEEGHH